MSNLTLHPQNVTMKKTIVIIQVVSFCFLVIGGVGALLTFTNLWEFNPPWFIGAVCFWALFLTHVIDWNNKRFHKKWKRIERKVLEELDAKKAEEERLYSESVRERMNTMGYFRSKNINSYE